MILGRHARRLSFGFVVMLLALGTAGAQESSQEFWPEADIWLRLSPAWRLSTFIALSRNIETNYREGSVIPQVDLAWGQTRRLRKTRLLDENRAQNMKAFMLRGGYLGGQSLDDQGDAYTERTTFAELHVRMPLKGDVLLTHRLRSDLRWLGDQPEFSQRWRYRLQVEKEFQAGRTSIVPYLNVEPYYDSRYDTVNRIRLIPGASLAWSPRFALEGNLTYQYDSKASITHVYAVNTILHVYFETRSAAP